MDKVCDERHSNCDKRMDSHAKDIDNIFDTRVPWRTFYWTLGILFLLVVGSFKYTNMVSDDIKDVVTTKDMERIQHKIIDAIKGSK